MEIKPAWYSRFWRAIKPFITGGLALGLILAVATCVINERNARVASVQTFNLTRVAAFQDSGRIMDEKVALLFDAAAGGANLDEPRSQARAAIVTHATHLEALEGVISADERSAYTQRLVALREAIDSTVDQTQSGRNITVLGQAVQTRRALVTAVLNRLQ